jgi:hypothetical protein
LAGRGPQTFQKRQKEQQRKEKQLEKLARRQQRKQEKEAGTTPTGESEETNLDDDLAQDPQPDRLPNF